LISSSIRTASFGGSSPRLRKRRTFAYDAVSTSIENVESGLRAASVHWLSSILSYASVLNRSRAYLAVACNPPTLPPVTPFTTPSVAGLWAATVTVSSAAPTSRVKASSRVALACTTAVATSVRKPASAAVTV
jgi:hypothetical protein